MDDSHARSLRWAALAAVGLLLGWLALTTVLIQMANEAMP